ncbi:ORC-CDC6 family AAA ATPase [Pontibacter pamirensis]|uniref:ORC-CDC6 family AAA ATPase n=1 Tax=Pontibacter pamirensis TaxID=2562824 RepID=UPI001389D419|nr:hypothetical protein [Pontibacter pamirensis]
MPSIINSAIYKLIKRAEKYDKEHLVKTFVDVGPLLTLLKSADHQIIYGRRGTGKTHALRFLEGELNKKNSVSIYLDMRNIGSNGGIYSDNTLSVPERATRLLIDTFSVIHEQILYYVLNNDEVYDLSKFGPVLDELVDSISEIEVIGNLEVEETNNNENSVKENFGFSASLKDLSLNFGIENNDKTGSTRRQKVSGARRHRVHFTTVNSIFTKIVRLLEGKDIWILLDEWAEIPLDLQPYLSDLLRRTLFPIQGITIKIGAIEKRTNFKVDMPNSYIGIETGADISTSLNLDEFMVFDNDAVKSKEFFQNLLFNHINEFLVEGGYTHFNKDLFLNSAFTQNAAFEELVRASEGVPRDAINIVLHAAIKADQNKISIPNIRTAARNWFTTDKQKAISSKQEANLLLRWIIDEVIGQRNSRAFLISSDLEDELIEYLYDNRVIHLIKQNISSKDNPGERYNVYAIDYGTYVHLINTTDEPRGLFYAETENGEELVEVPINDYRSIRRSILNLNEFYNSSAFLNLN